MLAQQINLRLPAAQPIAQLVQFDSVGVDLSLERFDLRMLGDELDVLTFRGNGTAMEIDGEPGESDLRGSKGAFRPFQRASLGYAVGGNRPQLLGALSFLSLPLLAPRARQPSRQPGT